MIETTPEGHRILIGKDGVRFFMFDSNRIHEGIDYIRRHDLRFVGINSFAGFTGNNISFLRDVRDFVEGISIPESHFDTSVLNELGRLLFLGFADNKNTDIDLSNFPNLSTLACEYSNRLLSLESCEQLRNLTLTKFKSPTGTLEELPKLASLASLDLFIPNIVSLAGIEKFQILRKLTLFRARHLEDISALQGIKATLADLEYDQCKKIRNYEALAEMANLKRLIIGNSAPIASLSFVKSLSKLEFISFVGTNIVDGDLSPTIGIGYVGFEDRRHYSHKFKEISGPQSDVL